ncbi:methyl-accepting chemotaxis protein [Vibrio sp. JC009]|uniref:methyl-accepting chemotaxis protein n=1 Tax=Vibrio sp. JC009 TaxID=2912314 RepID=UPI0023AEE0AD|nr:methyl-accepting chemotaxis protein [Vibrio sp. JC009]WED21500.1 methyl-accepting chemotaxis protein [Vibrio sp. JC009]
MYLSLIQRIILGFTVVILFVIAIGTSSYFSQLKMSRQLELTASTLTEMLDDSNVLMQHLQNVNRAMLVHANTQAEDNRAQLRGIFARSRTSYEQTLESLRSKLDAFPELADALTQIQGGATAVLADAAKHLALHDQRIEARNVSKVELGAFEEEWLFFQQDMQDLYDEAQSEEMQQMVWDIEYIVTQGKGADSYLQKVLAAANKEQAQAIESELILYLDRFKEKSERIIKGMPDSEDTLNVYVELLERAVANPDGLLQRHLFFIGLNDQSGELLGLIAQELNTVIDDSTELAAKVREISQQAVVTAKQESADALWLNLLLVIVSLAIAIGVAWTVVVTVRKPLQAIICNLMRLEKGDLTQRIDIDFRSELGQIGLHVNQLADQLSSLISKVQESARMLSSVAGESQQMSQQMSKDVGEQQRQTDSIATAVTEMEHAVHEVASHAVETSTEVDGVVQLAGSNMQNMQQNLTFVTELQASLTDATGVIQGLSAESEQIGEILSVIQSISEQTNLLALNAAIEAARAGEHGRGFAVVADEVRSLATRTQQSADEINTMIISLQDKSKQAVTIVESNLGHAEQSVEQTNQTYEALQHMVDTMKKVNDMSRSIATASEEQSAVAKEVAQNIVGISDMATNIDSDSNEVARNSESLNSLSSEQTELVSQFKI